jgi:hypothetical protein
MRFSSVVFPDPLWPVSSRAIGRCVVDKSPDEPGSHIRAARVELMLPVHIECIVGGGERPQRVQLTVQRGDGIHSCSLPAAIRDDQRSAVASGGLDGGEVHGLSCGQVRCVDPR